MKLPLAADNLISSGDWWLEEVCGSLELESWQNNNQPKAIYNTLL